MRRSVWWLACIACCVGAAERKEPHFNPPPEFHEIRERVYAGVSADDAKGFERMPEPQRGDWLYHFREAPQSLEKYKMTPRVQPAPERTTIVLQPLGAFDAEKLRVLEAMREYATIFFQLPARIAEPRALDASIEGIRRSRPVVARQGGFDTQYNAEIILQKVLKPNLPPDALVVLGITADDLWTRETNYVFGLGSFDERVGVYSLARYFPEFWGQARQRNDPEPYRVGLLRACKVLNHEAGHMFGLRHCVFYLCSMNGSNNLDETDRAPAHFCPVCHRKLQWNLQFDALKRFEDLRAFYAKHELKPEASWIEKRMENWKKVLATEKARAVREE